MARKNSKKALEIDEISSEYEFEENCFDNLVEGSPVATFSFANSFEQVPVQSPSNSIGSSNPNKTSTASFKNTEGKEKPQTCNKVNSNVMDTSVKLTDSRRGNPTPKGITPPIAGEVFDIKRGYTFRKSTVRKLNELKAAHPDVNVYLSTIIDDAINHYYNYVFGSNNEKY